MNGAGPGRTKSWLLVLFVLVSIAGVEAWNVYRQGVISLDRSPVSDAAYSGLFVLGTFGLVFALCTLVLPFRALRRIQWGLCLVLLVTFGSLLFLSWTAFWITGRPINFDAMGVLMESPLAAALHLLESDLSLLAGIVLSLLAFLGVMAWLLTHAVKGSVQVPERTRGLLALMFGFLIVMGAREINLTMASRSSFSAALGSPHSSLPKVDSYSCPRSPNLPVAATLGNRSANGAPVIVLMIESLRSDLMTTDSKAMPHLAELAKESVVFDRAYATSSHSDFEDLSFWYSRYPLRADHRLGYPVNAEWRGNSVFEYFKQRGYSTAYYSSQNEKWGGMINWLKIPAVDSYFDSENYTGETWENKDDLEGLAALIRSGRARAGKVEDSRTLDLAAAWIEQHAKEPFFIGLNLQNTHYNYYIPEGGAHPYQPDELGFRAIYSAWPKDQAPVVRNRYLNAAYNIDLAVKAFRDRLERAGVWDKATVLVIGDGGEGFYEHGFANHSGPMYDEVATTLALLKLPKGDLRNGTHWPHPVSHVDFVPLLAEAVGGETWPGFQGVSPWVRPPDAPVYLTADALVAEDSVVRWPWKLMSRRFPQRSIELYNLAEDPRETRNQRADQVAISLSMVKDLESFRMCQLGYYVDKRAHTALHPPRYFTPIQPSSSSPAVAAR